VVWYFIAEETAFKDLLKYMYSGTLRAQSTKELLDLLMVADKFQVTSFVDWCISVLLNLPMSTETALLYMDLPNVSMQSLIDTAKKFLLEQFGDIEK
jgi:hypothetical protein